MSNVQVVADLYEAFGRGDIPSVLAAFDPKIEWHEAEGNPYEPEGKPWFGPDAITQNLFVKLGAEWERQDGASSWARGCPFRIVALQPERHVRRLQGLTNDSPQFRLERPELHFVAQPA
jgi:hypothetical protein